MKIMVDVEIEKIVSTRIVAVNIPKATTGAGGRGNVEQVLQGGVGIQHPAVDRPATRR
jgi:hypothetical protein